MPITRAQYEEELVYETFAKRLNVRDLLHNVIVRRDGAWAGGFGLGGRQSLYYDAEQLNQQKSALEAVVRAIPDENHRLQFLFQSVEDAGPVLERYDKARVSTHPMVKILDTYRQATWRDINDGGHFQSRRASVYYIWYPPQENRERKGDIFSAAGRYLKNWSSGFKATKALQRTAEHHFAQLAEFEHKMDAMAMALDAAGLIPQRMTEGQLFDEIYFLLNPSLPQKPYFRPSQALIDCDYDSIARRLVDSWVSVGDEQDTINIDGIYYSVIVLKDAPNDTWPGLLRHATVLPIPLTLCVTVSVLDQEKFINRQNSRLRRSIAAQTGDGGAHKINVAANVTQNQIVEVLNPIIAGRCKACDVSVVFLVRTSKPARTAREREEALGILEDRRQRVLSVIRTMNGAGGYVEKYAADRIFLSSLPAMAEPIKREHTCISPAAADFLPVETTWKGHPDNPLWCFETPYSELLAVNPYDPRLDNHNVLILGKSGTGKSFAAQMALTQAKRANAQIVIIDPSGSYSFLVKVMGGREITPTLNSKETFNPWDLPPGQKAPSSEQVMFLTHLAVHMIAPTDKHDKGLLKSLLARTIKKTYDDFKERDDSVHFHDLMERLERYQDEKNAQEVNDLARYAALKLRDWCNDGPYANLFDRDSQIGLDDDWLYFNIGDLKKDPRLEAAFNFLIAQLIYQRSTVATTRPKIMVFDEAWSMLASETLSEPIIKMFREGRGRGVSAWAISQAATDFTGTPDNPLPYGPAILNSTSIKLIGRQRGEMQTLKGLFELNDTLIEVISNLQLPSKGKYGQFLLMTGDRPETSQVVFIRPSKLEYWIFTSQPHEKALRSQVLTEYLKDRSLNEMQAYQKTLHRLATDYPRGLYGGSENVMQSSQPASA